MSKRIFFKFIFISIITLVTFSSCKKEEINSVNLEFFPDTLLFDYDVDTNTVVLNCFGDIQTTWSLSSLPSYINVSPTSGTLTPGQSITLNVILDRSGFVSNDTYLDAIVITYKSGANYTTLTTQVKNFKQKKILLYKDRTKKYSILR